MMVFFAVMGPGIIAAIADNDASGVATYSILGAKYGYSILFFLLIITVLLAITQEMGARLSIVTGQGLGDLIREEYGIKISILIFILLMVANLGTTIANYAGLVAGFSIFGLPIIPSLIITTILIGFFISKGNYKVNQRIFLTAGLLYVVYIFSAVLAKPNWNLATTSLFLPKNIPIKIDFVFGMMALLGTTVTPWGQFFISSFIRDKKITVNHLRYEKLEVFFGAFITNFFSFFMVVACAATLFMHKIQIKNAADAALAIMPFAGAFASHFFGIGLIIASFMGAVIVPLTTAYAFAEFFGVEGSLDKSFTESKQFHLIFFAQIVIAFIIVLIPRFSLFKIVLYTQSLNGALLPVIIYFLLRFCNDSERMGRYINNKLFNYLSVFFSVIIVIASLTIAVSGIFGIL